VLRAGCLDAGERLVLEGWWRHGTSTEAGLARFFVEPAEVARALCTGTPAPGPPSLRGAMTGPTPSEPFPAGGTTLVRDRDLVDPVSRFGVVAHRGGCRTSDDCGASENSLEVIRLAPRLGANAIEIDVLLTRDGVPVLYHDAELNPRLVRGRYCLGPIEDFTLAHLRSLCRLAYGEEIPTLDQALRVAVEETNLGAVWIDTKTPDAIGPEIEAVRRARALALSRGRTIRFAIGLPDSEVFDAWMANRPPDVACLCELEPDDARRAGCQVWAPRWTLGPVTADVRALQAEGIGVAFWTLDEVEFIDIVLRESAPNAILTNRPGVVQHRFQTLGTLPEPPP
jgi:glycerophosphoryl diester phosphodiesterase